MSHIYTRHSSSCASSSRMGSCCVHSGSLTSFSAPSSVFFRFSRLVSHFRSRSKTLSLKAAWSILNWCHNKRIHTIGVVVHSSELRSMAATNDNLSYQNGVYWHLPHFPLPGFPRHFVTWVLSLVSCARHWKWRTGGVRHVTTCQGLVGMVSVPDGTCLVRVSINLSWSPLLLRQAEFL